MLATAVGCQRTSASTLTSAHSDQIYNLLEQLWEHKGGSKQAPAGALSSCAWKPDREPLTPNLKYQQRSIDAACYLLSSTKYGRVDRYLSNQLQICSSGILMVI